VYSTFQQAFGAPSQFQSNPNLGVFVQDEWRPRADLTINGGGRYDLQWLSEPGQLDANNVSPRLGVAYSPGNGRTVIRASGGLYFDRIPLRATSNALQRDGTKYQTAQLSDRLARRSFQLSGVVSPGLWITTTTINPRSRRHSEQASSKWTARSDNGWPPPSATATCADTASSCRAT
jgi:hypothetical protein